MVRSPAKVPHLQPSHYERAKRRLSQTELIELTHLKWELRFYAGLRIQIEQVFVPVHIMS